MAACCQGGEAAMDMTCAHVTPLKESRVMSGFNGSTMLCFGNLLKSHCVAEWWSGHAHGPTASIVLDCLH